MVTDLDFHISTSLEPSPFKNEELNDLARDLCLSKQQSEVLTSRLHYIKLFSAQTPKLLFIEIEKHNFFNTLFLKMILFTVAMSKGFCWQWVCQNMNQLIGDSLSTVQSEV